MRAGFTPGCGHQRMIVRSTSSAAQTVGRWLSLVPLASLLVAEYWIRDYDGWGAWAAAPVLILPGLLSLAFTAAFVACLLGARHHEGQGGGTAWLAPALIAAVPMMWLALRRYLV